MNQELNSESLRNARLARLSGFAEIENIMSRLTAQKNSLRQLLRSTAPGSVAQFLDDEDTIHDLFTYGQSSRKIRYNDNPYGFKNEAQVRTAFQALVDAWQRAVKITLTCDGESRIEVSVEIP